MANKGMKVLPGLESDIAQGKTTVRHVWLIRAIIAFFLIGGILLGIALS